MKLKFKKLRDVKTPTYGTEGAACFDFYVPDDIEYKLMKGYDTGIKVPLGLEVEVPEGYALFIVPRSSIGVKTPLRQSNSVGIIDSDYRGEIAVILDNLSGKSWIVGAGERVAQGFVLPVPTVKFEEVEELSETVELKCQYCGKKFIGRSKNRKYCSGKCANDNKIQKRKAKEAAQHD